MYLKSTVTHGGLLFVKLILPFHPAQEHIISWYINHGLLTGIHLHFNYPTIHQLKQLITRYFFALDLDNAIQSVVDNCHYIPSLKKVPTHLQLQSTSAPPTLLDLKSCDGPVR